SNVSLVNKFSRKGFGTKSCKGLGEGLESVFKAALRKLDPSGCGVGCKLPYGERNVPGWSVVPVTLCSSDNHWGSKWGAGVCSGRTLQRVARW
uniref:Uncharacterized protein n=1 Tax=Bubo bubo TaxID=30461 RepID=A0A8C0ER22_BUBBB